MQHPALRPPRDSQGVTEGFSTPAPVPVEQQESQESQTDLARTGLTMRREGDQTPARSSIADAVAAGHVYRTIERLAEQQGSRESRVDTQTDIKLGSPLPKPRRSR